jgi:phage baseplate assembly protein W
MTIQKLKVSRLYKDLDLDMSAPNPVTGDAPKKTDVNAVKQSIKILMLTNFYERPFAPKKAGNISGLLFEPMSPLVSSTMSKVIEKLLQSYEPRANIQSVTVEPDFDNNAYTINITFYVVGINKPQSLTTRLKRVR